MVDPLLSTRELDRLAGFPEGHTWMLEDRVPKRGPETTSVDSIARVLGISLDWLIRGEGRGPKSKDVNAAVKKARAAARAA